MGEQVLAKRAPGWLLGHPCEDLKERFKGSERYVRNMSHCRFDKSFQELTDHGAAEREREKLESMRLCNFQSQKRPDA